MTKRFKHSGRIYWIQFFINYFVWATLVAAGVFAVVNARWIVLFICIVTFSLTFLPYLFEEKFDIDIPVEFEILLVVFVYATLFLGEVGNFYTHFWWWDIILHVGSAVAFGIIGFMILFVLYNQGKVQMNPIWLAIFSFAFAMAIGSIWEIFEFGMDQIFGMNMQKSGLMDTMADLIIDSIGALFASALGFLYLKGKGRFSFNVLLERFVKDNPKLFGS
ncbi:hypothetical protein HN747_02290 [archaeon]|jgi:hypothetical protein|nr:hypothetical protein [archaeon]